MSQIRDMQHPNVEIAVRNFGPIPEATIDLRPLTVFIGPSNTGKTYFSTQIYALHNIFNGFSESGFLSLFGPAGFMGPMTDNKPEQRILLDPDIAEAEIQELTEKFFMTDEIPLKLSDLPTRTQNRLQDITKESEVFKEALQDELKNCFDLNSILTLIRLTEKQHNEMTISLKVSERNQEYWKINLKASESGIAVDGSISKNMPILPEGWGLSINSSAEKGKRVFLNYPSPNSRKRNRYYLPAARSGIMQSHRVIMSSLVKRTTRVGLERFPEVPTLPGVIAEFMQQIILYEEDRGPNDEIQHIADVLETDVLAGQIHVKPSPSGYPDFRYLPYGTKEDMRLSQVSSMISELAPLVLFIRGLIRPGDTLIIEEPEAHLHPGAQTEIAATLGRLIRAGVRVVVTTHSDWLLKEIGNLIREGVLKEKGELRKKPNGPESWLLPNEVGAWQFHREKPVEPLHFTNLDGIDPPDYEELALNLYNRSVGLHNQLEVTEGDNTSE